MCSPITGKNVQGIITLKKESKKLEEICCEWLDSIQDVEAYLDHHEL